MRTSDKIRTYSELIRLPTFRERFEYLKLDGTVGEETFGSRRYLNQAFYHSDGWLSVRDYVITRDLGRDLATEGYDIHGAITLHHMNPIDELDIVNLSEFAIDPEFLICTTDRTHKAIHYGDETLLVMEPIVRTPHDTCPWIK